MIKASNLFLLCVLWILVTTVSNSIAMAYEFSLIQESRSTWNEYVLRGLFVSGLLSGLGQWVLIKTRVKGTWAWIFINALGIPLGLILGHYLYSGFELLVIAITGQGAISFDWTDIVYLIVVISIAGTVLGILQWLALKNKVEFAYWWIPISALSWNIGLQLAYEMSDLIDPAIWNYNWSISGAIFGLVLGGIVGTIGSVTIRKMLISPKRLSK